MKEVTKRLFLAGIVIPLLIIIVFLLPYMHYLALLAAVIFFTYTGTLEFIRISLKEKISAKGAFLSALTGVIFPVLFYLQVNNYISIVIMEIILAASASLILIINLILFEINEDSIALKRLTVQIASIIYPGYFLGYTVKFTSLPHSSGLMVFFLLVVFINDSAAYASGMLWGRKSCKPFKVSPKKSIVGFIGGTIAAVASGVIFIAFNPDVIPVPLYIVAALAFILSLTANTGDLIESVLKRSAGVKDSGAIMMGRGGVLDSIDSLLFTAPAYYFILLLLV